VESLDGLTIGRLAEELHLSKSGLFTHFGSKQNLQLVTIESARQVYLQNVISPALACEAGLERLERLRERFLSYLERGVFPGGCVFASAIAKFNCTPGAVRDRIGRTPRLVDGHLCRATASAIEAGDRQACANPEQPAFDLQPMPRARDRGPGLRRRSTVRPGARPKPTFPR
jgi:AcrR family transcriptional regulator